MNSALFLGSNPSSPEVADEYKEWYERHLVEVLGVPGMMTATRYETSEVPFGDRPPVSTHRYYTVYELDGPDPTPAMARMKHKSVIGDWKGNADESLYTLGNTANIVLEPLSAAGPTDLSTMNALLVVGTESASPEAEDEFQAWHVRHVNEVLDLPGYVAATRYVASAERYGSRIRVADADSSPQISDGFHDQAAEGVLPLLTPLRYLTIYELDAKDPKQAAAAIASAIASGHFTGSDTVNHAATAGQFLSPFYRAEAR